MGEIDAHGQRWITTRERVSSGNAIASACLDTSPCGAGTNGFNLQRTGTHRRSRRTLRARFSKSFRPRQSEGAGNAGCALHPRSRVQYARDVRTRAYRAAESIRHSLRNGFTTYSALSLVIGFLATIAGRTYRQLDASTEASGPHAFAVHVSHARQSQPPRPSQPVPRS
jgi:hypothetical protein